MDTHPGLAPGKIGFADRQLVDFAMCVIKWSGAWDSHPPGRLHRPECCWLHHHLVLRTAVKWILRPESHRHRLLYERSAFLALPRRNETGAPARNCTSTLRLRTAACTALTPREQMGKRLHHAGAAPTRAVWKTAMRAATSMMLDWWLNSELRRTLLGFSEALICLSYSAVKLVPPRGNAPRSISNRLMALLLSYGGYCHKKSPVKVTHPRLPGVGRARCYYANGRVLRTAVNLRRELTALRRSAGPPHPDSHRIGPG